MDCPCPKPGKMGRCGKSGVITFLVEHCLPLYRSGILDKQTSSKTCEVPSGVLYGRAYINTDGYYLLRKLLCDL